MRFKLAFAGFGRRGIEALIAILVLAVASAVVAFSAMVVEGARATLHQVEIEQHPDVIQVKGRFNRALFETPRSGYLQPLTLPVYEPLIDPNELTNMAGGATVLKHQSLLRNVVSGDSFLNVYIFGIEPDKESLVSAFALQRGRFLQNDDRDAAALDEASARALDVDVGGSFLVRKADGADLRLTVVGVLQGIELFDSPPTTVEAPALKSGSPFVSSGVFVTLRTSESILARQTLTDALVIADSPDRVPDLVTRLKEVFRLEPAVFVEETYTRYLRQVSDFQLTLVLFAAIGSLTAINAGAFVAKLMHDAYEDRRRQYALLLSLGFSPVGVAGLILGFGLAVALVGGGLGSIVALAFKPPHFLMPSLMADLGTVVPRFDFLVAALVAGVAIVAALVGMARIVWILGRGPIAAALMEGG
jgi:ABC-type antimicrobial peptide transport system permease subunit